MSAGLERFVAAAPQPHRAGLKLLIALGSRPRGLRVLRHAGPAEQLATGLVAMGRYEDPVAARALGWDADAVAARGRARRRAEGRP